MKKKDGRLCLPRLAHLIFLPYFKAGAVLSRMEVQVPEIMGLDYFQIKMNNISPSTSCPWPSNNS
jgi:hypothetical protein